jgi:hypothetical protein
MFLFGAAVSVNGAVLTIDVTDSSRVTLAGKVLTINPTAPLDGLTEYAVQMAAGVVRNLNDLPNAAITDTTRWSFTTKQPRISGTDVVVDLSSAGARNRFAAGWVSIDGNLGVGESITLHSTGTSTAQSNSVLRLTRLSHREISRTRSSLPPISPPR